MRRKCSCVTHHYIRWVCTWQSVWSVLTPRCSLPFTLLWSLPSCPSSHPSCTLCPSLASGHLGTCCAPIAVFPNCGRGKQNRWDRTRAGAVAKGPCHPSGQSQEGWPSPVWGETHLIFPILLLPRACSGLPAPLLAVLLCPTHPSALTLCPVPPPGITSFYSLSLPLGPRGSAHPGDSHSTAPS